MGTPTRYQFIVDGMVSDRVLAAFPELAMARGDRGFTSLYGPVTDYSSLRGIFARLDALGLMVVELRRLPD